MNITFTTITTSTTSQLSSTITSGISTKTSTTVTQTLPNVVTILNASFSFSTLSSSQTIFLLNTNYDLSGCIVNCSNNGQCRFDLLSNQFFCSCNTAFLSGAACQLDTRPCSSNPCLGNSTCVDYTNNFNHNISNIVK